MDFLLGLLVLLSFDSYITSAQLSEDAGKLEFPPIDIPNGLLFGASTSAFQTEGALSTNGRTKSSVELLLSRNQIPDWGSPDSPEISGDSYHKFKEDVKILKDIGLNIYRFSMSWTRLLPTGYPEHVNQEGVEYYHALLTELEQAGIEPMVQLHHFDHPAVFDDFGGWKNESMVEIFKNYAKFVFGEFGHRVKYFLTFNEPNVLCDYSESGILKQDGGIASTFPNVYQCSHNILKAHAQAYHLYHDEFNSNKKGAISINLMCYNFIAEKEENQPLVDIAFAFSCRWFADPIYSKTGDYPEILKERVKEMSALQGYDGQQLPAFSDWWISRIRGSADFFGLSYYSTRIVEPANDLKSAMNFFMPPETGIALKADPSWPTTGNRNFIVPYGLRAVLKKVKELYDNPTVHIIENGLSTDDRLNDTDRIKFIYAHVEQIIYAINDDKCDVKSYLYWSLIDVFEFWDAYRSRFGLAHVDFSSPNRTKTLKESGIWLRNVLHTRKLHYEG